MAKTKLNVTNLGNVCYTNSKEIIARMQEISNKLPEAPVAEKVLITLELNALVKALAKLLSNNLNCSDDVVKETLTNAALADTQIVIGINNTDYLYTKADVEETVVDKAWIASQGFPNQTKYGEYLDEKDLPLPKGLSKEVMYKFKPNEWDGNPIGHVVSKEVITIKENKNK